MKRHRYSELTVVSLVLVVLAACEPSAPTTPLPEPTLAVTEDHASGHTEFRSVPRFTIDVDAIGTFRPGEPVEVIIRGMVHIPTSDAELRVVLPEVRAAARSEWGDGFAVPVGEPLAPSLSRDFGADSGLEISERISVTVPAPGYYRVVATLRNRSPSDHVRDGAFVYNVAHGEAWLWIDEDGGGVTPEMDLAVFPENAVREPGPFRSVSQSYAGPPRQGTDAAGSIALQGTPNAITYRSIYFNFDTDQFEAVPYAGVTVETCTVPSMQFVCEEPDWVHFLTSQTDSDGYVNFDCPEEVDEYRGWVVTSNQHVLVSAPGSLSGFTGDPVADCGDTFDSAMGSGSAHSFVHMTKTALGSIDLFGIGRPQLKVVHDANASVSTYSPSQDEVTIKSGSSGNSHIWDELGVFVHGHEFGHAVHAVALNGDLSAGATSACRNREFDGETNLGCALVEGFATYHGVATRPDVGTYEIRSQIALNAWFPGGGADGALIEATVAAFLFDVTDPANEPHDNVEAPGYYMRDIVATCEVWQSLSWIDADGVDHLVYCMEEDVDSAVTGSSTWFTSRSTAPTDERSSAQSSGTWGWSQANIRKLWLWNLYGES